MASALTRVSATWMRRTAGFGQLRTFMIRNWLPVSGRSRFGVICRCSAKQTRGAIECKKCRQLRCRDSSQHLPRRVRKSCERPTVILDVGAWRCSGDDIHRACREMAGIRAQHHGKADRLLFGEPRSATLEDLCRCFPLSDSVDSSRPLGLGHTSHSRCSIDE